MNCAWCGRTGNAASHSICDWCLFLGEVHMAVQDIEADKAERAYYGEDYNEQEGRE